MIVFVFNFTEILTYNSEVFSYCITHSMPHDVFFLQVMCDSDLRITNCIAKWPGSVHDGRIRWESALFADYEGPAKPLSGYILGDSGYMLREWLLTPIINPQSQKEEQYNAAHCATRCTVERCTGVVIRRWHCLQVNYTLLHQKRVSSSARAWCCTTEPRIWTTQCRRIYSLLTASQTVQLRRWAARPVSGVQRMLVMLLWSWSETASFSSSSARLDTLLSSSSSSTTLFVYARCIVSVYGFVVFTTSVLWHCCLCDRNGIQPVKILMPAIPKRSCLKELWGTSVILVMIFYLLL